MSNEHITPNKQIHIIYMLEANLNGVIGVTHIYNKEMK